MSYHDVCIPSTSTNVSSMYDLAIPNNIAQTRCYHPKPDAMGENYHTAFKGIIGNLATKELILCPPTYIKLSIINILSTN